MSEERLWDWARRVREVAQDLCTSPCLREPLDALVEEMESAALELRALNPAEKCQTVEPIPEPERKADAPFDFPAEARLWGETEARVMEAEYNLTRAVAALTHAARAAGREQVREAEERAQQTQAVAALLGD